MFEFDKGIDASKEMILFERFMKFLNAPPFLVDSCYLGIIACGITARQIDFTLRVIKLVGPEHVVIPAKLVLSLMGSWNPGEISTFPSYFSLAKKRKQIVIWKWII